VKRSEARGCADSASKEKRLVRPRGPPVLEYGMQDRAVLLRYVETEGMRSEER
jgi:hypothetical protein